MLGVGQREPGGEPIDEGRVVPVPVTESDRGQVHGVRPLNGVEESFATGGTAVDPALRIAGQRPTAGRRQRRGIGLRHVVERRGGQAAIAPFGPGRERTAVRLPGHPGPEQQAARQENPAGPVER
jgi:hypothetical protein